MFASCNLSLKIALERRRENKRITDGNRMHFSRSQLLRKDTPITHYTFQMNERETN